MDVEQWFDDRLDAAHRERFGQRDRFSAWPGHQRAPAEP